MIPEEYFKSYPGKEKCYQTSDGIIFHHRGDAQLHAQSLKDDEVKEHKAVKLTADKSEAIKAAKQAKEKAAK